MRAHVVAYGAAGVCVLLALSMPIVEINGFEGAPTDAEAGDWVAMLLATGIALLVVGHVVRRRGMAGGITAAFAISLGVLFVLTAGGFASFGVAAIVDMRDSDAHGYAGPGRPFATLAAVAAIVGVVADLTSTRRTVTAR